MESVRGKLYGNIFAAWRIVRIDPRDGCVEAVADMSGLESLMSADEKTQIADINNVLNGVAYDDTTEQFYVTGKRWQAIYVGKFVEIWR